MLGLVDFEDARRVPAGQRSTWTVAEIMSPEAGLTLLAPEAAAGEAVRTLSQRPAGQVPVAEGGGIRGLLRREHILMWLALNERGESTAR